MIILYLPNVYKTNEALSFLTSWLFQCGNFKYVIYLLLQSKRTHPCHLKL